MAAAADLQPVMPALAFAYQKETGTKLEVSFGSSSALATQIINGAPVDVFLGADFTFPEKVIAANLATEKLPVPYAQGTLVLWARKDSPAQPVTLDELTTPKITRIAVADEFHAPFGRAAHEALRALKIEDKLKDKFVVAENVSQSGQFAATGNAQVAFISLTLAMSPQMKDSGSYMRVPPVYPEIKQCAVVIRHPGGSEPGERFLEWLRSSPVQAHLHEFGLEPVR